MQAEEVYRRYFKDLAMEFYNREDRDFQKKFKSIIINYIKGELYMGLHVMEIADPLSVGLVCEIAYYGAGGKWEDLV
jgi:hypothetical protein